MNDLTRAAFIVSAFALLTACQGAQSSSVVPTQAIANAHKASSSSYAVLYRFNLEHGQGTGYPIGALTNVNGTMYGATSLGGNRRHHQGHNCAYRTCGAVYTVTTSGAYTVIHAFSGGPKDGANPHAGMTDADGTLYGTTAYGGAGSGCASGCGTVYSIDATGSETVLYSFAGGADASRPNSALLYLGGALYGTTDAGGSSAGCASSLNCGAVYTVTTSGQERVLYAFKGGAADGDGPSSALIDVKGTMYGATGSGGGTGCTRSLGCGTIYSITKSGQEKVVHSFSGGADGSGPGGLVYAKGLIYGTTSAGGSTGNGVVYSMTTAGKENVLYNFQGGSDAYCVGAPLLYVKGKLYGTSFCGGGCPGVPCGTVFSVTTKGVEQVLYGFTDMANGRAPAASLIDVNGTLYSTTTEGGEAKGGSGVIFSISP